jgi:hypothetical protein
LSKTCQFCTKIQILKHSLGSTLLRVHNLLCLLLAIRVPLSITWSGPSLTAIFENSPTSKTHLLLSHQSTSGSMPFGLKHIADWHLTDTIFSWHSHDYSCHNSRYIAKSRFVTLSNKCLSTKCFSTKRHRTELKLIYFYYKAALAEKFDLLGRNNLSAT